MLFIISALQFNKDKDNKAYGFVLLAMIFNIVVATYHWSN
jgi:hypothetical protein